MAVASLEMKTVACGLVVGVESGRGIVWWYIIAARTWTCKNEVATYLAFGSLALCLAFQSRGLGLSLECLPTDVPRPLPVLDCDSCCYHWHY